MAKTKDLNLELNNNRDFSGKFIDEYNENLQTLDDHDHSAGKGNQIKISALDVDSNLDMQAKKVTNSKGIVFTEDSNLSNSQLGEKNGNLIFKNQSGTEVPLTQGSNIAGGGGGGGGGGGNANLGNYSPPASLNYNRGRLLSTNTSIVYEFFRNLGSLAYAGIKAAFLKLQAGNGNDVTVKPHATSNAIDLTLPQSLPSSEQVVKIDSSGNISISEVTDAQITSMSSTKLTGNIPESLLPVIAKPKTPFSEPVAFGDVSGRRTNIINNGRVELFSFDVPTSGIGPKFLSLTCKWNGTFHGVTDTDGEEINFVAPFQIDEHNASAENLVWRMWHYSGSNPNWDDGRTLASGVITKCLASDATRNQFDEIRTTNYYAGTISAGVMDRNTRGKYGFSIYTPNIRNSRTVSGARYVSLDGKDLVLIPGWEIEISCYYQTNQNYRD